MNKKLWIIAVLLVPVVIVAGSAGGLALATGGGDDEPLTGTDLEKASQAALKHTGGGTVVETEVGDDGAAYGVEVRLDDGQVVEVNLDENFKVTGQENDDDGGGGEDEGGTEAE